MQSAPLTTEQVSEIPEAKGVYQLLLNDEIAYIGKTDAKSGLLKRLTRHACKIQHRQNLEVDEVSFKAIRVFVFTAVDLESQLIGHYRGRSSVSWNNSGFGSNDPGRNRDKTAALPNTFDVRYPVDLNRPISLAKSGEVTVKVALDTLRSDLPYTLRFRTSQELKDTSLTLPERRVTAREVLKQALGALNPGWQATALEGRIIIYKETDDHYPGYVIARS